MVNKRRTIVAGLLLAIAGIGAYIFTQKGKDEEVVIIPMKHNECVGGICKEVPGFGISTCNLNSECKHTKCVLGICQVVNSPGVDECKNMSECVHNECSGGKCVSYIGKGEDECDKDSLCSYKKCDGISCKDTPVDVIGQKDECDFNADCLPENLKYITDVAILPKVNADVDIFVTMQNPLYEQSSFRIQVINEAGHIIPLDKPDFLGMKWLPPLAPKQKKAYWMTSQNTPYSMFDLGAFFTIRISRMVKGVQTIVETSKPIKGNIII